MKALSDRGFDAVCPAFMVDKIEAAIKKGLRIAAAS